MKLVKFRVTKYRNIQDSGSVELFDQLTCIVGKNQSGKTSLLKALHKFNPHNKAEKYKIAHDWPRGERRQRDPKQVVCEATFELDAEEQKTLAQIAAGTMDAKHVCVAKNYSQEFEVKFPSNPDLFPEKLHPNVVDEQCKGFLGQPQEVGAEFARVALECGDEVSRVAKEGRYSDLAGLEQPLVARLNAARTPANQQPHHQNENNFVSTFTQRLKEMASRIPSLPTMHAAAHEYVVKRLPVFIYMDDYREFQGEALLDQLKNRRNSPTPEDETILMTLSLAGLDLDKLVEQGKSNDPAVIHERQYDLADGAKSLTNDVAGRWGQTPYRVEFRCDGQKFFTDIEETNKDIGMIPLSEQSKGFRWFFSFDLRFMHDSGGSFKDCVLLLDEPGLHLHPGGQEDLLKRLDAYAKDNVLIYTTHLPFLVDLREPSRIHVIKQEGDNATVTDDLGASGPDEKMTLQAALGMKLNQHFLVAQSNLVVEGVDDFWIISEVSNLFVKNGKTGIPDEIEITAAGGASEVVYMATFIVGQNLNVLALFDSDKEGRVQEGSA